MQFPFCIIFFVLLGRGIYQEYSNPDLIYEYTTGNAIEVSKITDKTNFKVKKFINIIKSDWYAVKIKLDDGEIIEIPVNGYI